MSEQRKRIWAAVYGAALAGLTLQGSTWDAANINAIDLADRAVDRVEDYAVRHLEATR